MFHSIAAFVAGLLALVSGGLGTPQSQPASAALATEGSTSTSAGQIATTTVINNTYVTNPVVERIIDATPSSSTGPTDYVTQAQLSALGESLRALIFADIPNTAPVSQNVAGGGNYSNPFAAAQNITHLTGVTITGSTIDVASIPDISATYLTVSGGTLSGSLNLTSASTTNFSVFGTAYFGGTATSTFTSAGWLGIGTTSPTEALDVNGNINIATTTASAGIIKMGGSPFIYSYLDPASVGGASAFQNIVIGEGSGNFTMSAGGGRVDLGSGNIIVGNNSLSANTTGEYNTVVAAKALPLNTTGSYNVAIGGQSFLKNTTGSYNVGIGTDTFTQETTATYNVGIGPGAMGSTTFTGSDNIGVGTDAMRNITTGRDNTGLGHNSLWTISTGNENTVVGSKAFYNITNAADNVGVGYAAGYYNTTGQYNVMLGGNAGVTSVPANANTTGNYNIWLGYNAGPGTASQLTDAIGIGHGVVNTASNQMILGSTTQSNVIANGILTDQISDTTAYSPTLLAVAPHADLQIYNTSPTASYAGLVFTSRVSGSSIGRLALVNGGPGTYGDFAFMLRNAADTSHTTEFMRLTGTGNLGLGTTSPYAKFSISANSGDTNTTLFSIASSTANATTSLFTVLNNGNVGIGTTTPFGKLSLAANGAGSGTVFQIVNSSNLATLSMLDNGTMAYQSSVNSASGGNTFIQNLPAAQPSGTVTGTYTGFRTSMGYNSASDTSGAVTGIQGVGRLYVGAANQTQGIYGIAEYDGTGTNSGSLYGGRFQSQITNAGNVTHVIGVKIEGPVIATGATATNAYGLYVQGMTTGNAGTIGGSAAIEIEGAGSGNSIAFSGNGGSGIYSKLYSSNTNELNIEASSNLLLNTLGGKVGIGTSSPLAVLDIAGANNVSNPLFQLSSVSSFATTTQFIVTNAGKVSVGTTSASDDLNVGDLGSLGLINANPEIKLRNGDLATTFGIDFPELSTQAGAIRLFRNTNTAGSLSFSILKGDGTSATQTFLAGGVGNSYLNALGGKVGIGTTSPFALLSLSNSATTAANTPLLVVASTTGGTSTTTVFTIASTGNVTITGSAATCTLGNGASATSCSSSDQRLKDDITTIDPSSSLAAVESLRPVSFKWNQWMVGNGASTSTQFGFIAQEIQNTFPNLVTLDPNTHYYKLDYQGLFAPLVGATQALAHTVSDFADSFTTKELTFTRATGDEIDVNTVKTKQLCIDDVCVTKSQLQSMLAAAGGAGTGGGSTTPAGGSTSPATSTPLAGQADTTAPVITISGDNPATVRVGTTYADLGASVSDNVDQNLGIRTFLNGVPVDSITIDTSAATTDTIDYVATDNAGNTATSTRTVIVAASQNTQATSATATSTAQ